MESLPDARYLRGKIYTIKNINDDRVYVGSTTESLKTRFSKHKHDCKNYPQRTSLYKHINDWNDWQMTLYENYSCLNKRDLERRESEVIMSFPDVINKKKQFRQCV
jgi:hypothetical protein